MNLFLKMAFLFFMGSLIGWGLEVLFRRFVSPGKRWVNPGFCTGPYLPLYGVSLCILYLLASFESLIPIQSLFWSRFLLFVIMTLCMTVLEYFAGLLALKGFKVRLWDYRNEWGNLQGIICPRFSAIWAALSAIYYFLIHPYIQNALHWLSNNLAFSFVIGLFFGVFLIDIAHSAQLVTKLKRFAEENHVVVKYEALKENIRSYYESNAKKYHFFRPFHSDRSLSEYLKDMLEGLEQQRRKNR